MLDIKFIRENADLIKEAARKKHMQIDVDRLIELDDARREVLGVAEKKRAEQNAANEKIAEALNFLVSTKAHANMSWDLGAKAWSLYLARISLK